MIPFAILYSIIYSILVEMLCYKGKENYKRAVTRGLLVLLVSLLLYILVFI